MSTKRILALCMAVCLVFIAFLGCAQTPPAPAPAPEAPAPVAPAPVAPVPEAPVVGMVPGDYPAVCRGFYGDFDVVVTVSESAITNITLGEHAETPAIGGKGLLLMRERILAANTAGVDTVSGATLSSLFLRNAVQECLTLANAPDALLVAPAEAPAKQETITTDVLVIGSGAAGFSAAITAAQGGAKVTMIEKQDIIGGSTVSSAGIVYAAVDKKDYAPMVEYYLERAEGDADKKLLQYYAENSLSTIAFLEDMGVQWMMTVPAGTSPVPRARFSIEQGGQGMQGCALINPLEAKAASLGVTVLTGVCATELTKDASGAVNGALAQSKTCNYTFQAGAVVLATGGFDASKEMIAKYSPEAEGDFPLSCKANTGDGIRMGMAVGAATEFKGGVIGFAVVDGSLPESGYNAIAMYVNSYVKPDGEFVMNLIDYPITHAAIKEAGVDFFYGLYDAKGADNAQRAIDKGFGFRGQTIEELAANSGMDPVKLADAFSKTDNIESGPYFAVVVKPATIGSMGGLKINTASEVLSEAGNSAIPGLYAAGEVANGGFYKTVYPASGSSISLALTFGRQAGTNAAAFALAK